MIARLATIMLTMLAVAGAAEYRLVTAAHGHIGAQQSSASPSLHALGVPLVTAEQSGGTVTVAVGYIAQIRRSPSSNNAPTASDSEVITMAGVPRLIRLPGSDPDGDSLSFTILSQPSGGSVSLEDASTGSIRFVPGSADGEHFTYRMSDGTDVSAPITVTTWVTATDEARPRIVSPPPLAVEQDSVLSHAVAADNRQLDAAATLEFHLVGSAPAGMTIKQETERSAVLQWLADAATGSHHDCGLLVVDPAARRAGYQPLMLRVAPPAAALPQGDG